MFIILEAPEDEETTAALWINPDESPALVQARCQRSIQHRVLYCTNLFTQGGSTLVLHGILNQSKSDGLLYVSNRQLTICGALQHKVILIELT